MYSPRMNKVLLFFIYIVVDLQFGATKETGLKLKLVGGNQYEGFLQLSSESVKANIDAYPVRVSILSKFCQKLSGGDVEFHTRRNKLPSYMQGVSKFEYRFSLSDNCSIIEDNVYDCNIAEMNDLSHYPHDRDVYLSCSTSKKQLQLSLDRYGNEGWLTISTSGGLIGFVESQVLTMNDADVICRQLFGFSARAILKKDYVLSNVTSNNEALVFSTNFGCSGDELNINQCSNRKRRLMNFYYKKYRSYLICNAQNSDIRTRLYGGSNKFNGVLQISTPNTVWAGVHYSSQPEKLAKTFCQEKFGLPLDLCTFQENLFRRDNLQRYRFGYNLRLNCNTEEPSLLSCNDVKLKAVRYRLNNLFISCSASKLELSLEDGSSNYEGWLKIRRGGNVEGFVSYAEFSVMDANVACNQILGVQAHSVLHTSYALSTPSNRGKPLFKTRFGCHGNEANINLCPIQSKELDTSYKEYGAAFVVCRKPNFEYFVRLNGTPNSRRGFVQISIDKRKWAYINKHHYNDNIGKVICNQITGRPSSSVQSSRRGYNNVMYDRAPPSLVNGVRCTGNEMNLADCQQSVWTIRNTQHPHVEDLYIRCIQ